MTKNVLVIRNNSTFRRPSQSTFFQTIMHQEKKNRLLESWDQGKYGASFIHNVLQRGRITLLARLLPIPKLLSTNV